MIAVGAEREVGYLIHAPTLATLAGEMGLVQLRKHGLHRLWKSLRKAAVGGLEAIPNGTAAREAAMIADEMGLAHGTAREWASEWQALHLFSTFAFTRQKQDGATARMAALPPRADMTLAGQLDFNRQVITF